MSIISTFAVFKCVTFAVLKFVDVYVTWGMRKFCRTVTKSTHV